MLAQLERSKTKAQAQTPRVDPPTLASYPESGADRPEQEEAVQTTQTTQDDATRRASDDAVRQLDFESALSARAAGPEDVEAMPLTEEADAPTPARATINASMALGNIA
eukprot:2101844-Rhodomonas_salina.1